MEPIPLFGKQYVSKVCPAIDAVLEEIRIIIFDWRVDKNEGVSEIELFNQAIYKAVKRGVKVRAIVNSEKVKDVVSKFGVEARVITSEKLMHTKLLILDRFHIVLGSHNFTQSAFSANHELSVYFVVQDFENPYIEYFERLWLS